MPPARHPTRAHASTNMDDSTTLLWGLIFGVIGLAFFSYGKKQKAIVPLFSGVALLLFPYFISNVYLLVLIGVILVAIPYFVRI